jgi:hypothetical protein
VINIDQTWLNDLNFHRRCWAATAQRNTRDGNPVTPRLSMLMAIDTDGNLYCSLTQVNTDHRVFCLFLSKLVERLNAEDKDWRKNSIILIDGAKYQTSKESQKYMRALGINYIISAPYSFAATPIEYAFSFLKAVHLNPLGLKTGKK